MRLITYIKKNKNISFFYNQFIKYYWKYIILISIFSFCGSLFILMLPIFAMFTINQVVTDAEYVKWNFLVISMVIIATISLIFDYYQSYIVGKLMGSIFYEKTLILLPKAIKSEKKHEIGDITNRLTDNLKNVIFTLLLLIPTFLSSIIQIFAILIILLTESPLLTLQLYLPSILILTIFVYNSNRIEKSAKDQIDSYSNVFSIIKTIFINLDFINSNLMQKYFINRYENILDNYKNKQIKLSKSISIQTILGSLLFIIPTILLLSVGSYLIINKKMSIGLLVLFVSYAISLSNLLRGIVGNYNTIIQNIPTIARLNELYSENQLKFGDKELKVTEGTIKFQNIKYKNSRLNFDEISGEFKKGLNFIIGKNGSGKTTLINIINRLEKIESGKITIDEIDIKDFSEKSLRQNISYVMDKSFIFDGTLRENITLNKPNISDEKIIEVIKKVQLEEFFNKAPDGLDTMLYEDNVNLSAGERQKVSLARSLVHDYPILFLDEFATNMDYESVKKIYKLIKELSKDKTIILIDHDIHEKDLDDDVNIIHL